MWRREGPTLRQNPMGPALHPPVQDMARSLVRRPGFPCSSPQTVCPQRAILKDAVRFLCHLRESGLVLGLQRELSAKPALVERQVLDHWGSYCRGDGRCWSHVYIRWSRLRVGGGRLQRRTLDNRSWCCIRDGRCWSHVFIYRSRRRVGDGRLQINGHRGWCCVGDGWCWSNVFNRWSRRRVGDGRLRMIDHRSWCCIDDGG